MQDKTKEKKTKLQLFLYSSATLVLGLILASLFFVELSYNSATSSIIFMVKDSTTSGVVEANNIKINGIEVGIEKMRDGAIWLGGMSVAAKIVKGSSLPIGAKLGATVGMGAISLIGYKMVENNLSRGTRGNIGINADKVSISTSNPYIKKLSTESESMEGGSKDCFNISSLDVEQLQLDFYLQIVIIYLLIILFVFLIMKSISDRDLKLEFLNKLPFIQTLLLKVFKWWGNTNVIWVYTILITVLISMIISAWSIYIILNNLS